MSPLMRRLRDSAGAAARHRCVRASLVMLIGWCAGVAPAAAERFSFVALGDAPYGKPSEVYPHYRALIEAINDARPELVIHVGDTKAGSAPCTDDLLDEQHAFLNAFDAPTLYTPGDNEWTDCGRITAGGFDPVERLAYIRRTYFDDPARSFGRSPRELDHQGAAGYPENVRLLHKRVLFTTLHVVGSNNNHDSRAARPEREFPERNAMNIEWMKQGFSRAAGAGVDAIVVAMHADMFEFDFNEIGDEDWLRHSGFRDFGRALKRAAKDLGKPVLLVFGDSHDFQVFKPFPATVPNVTALEVFGGSEMHAVEVTFDTGAGRTEFSVSPLRNPAL